MLPGLVQGAGGLFPAQVERVCARLKLGCSCAAGVRSKFCPIFLFKQVLSELVVSSSRALSSAAVMSATGYLIELWSPGLGKELAVSLGNGHEG